MSLSRLGLIVPPVGPWSAQARGYRWAEEVGYDVVYTADHLTHPTFPGLWLGEAFTTLTAAAAVTDRIMLGMPRPIAASVNPSVSSRPGSLMWFGDTGRYSTVRPTGRVT
jgi:hypothetical protein